MTTPPPDTTDRARTGAPPDDSRDRVAEGAGSAVVPEPEVAPRGRLAEVTGLFLRLGLTAFGGPAAHIAMLQAECVQRRAWLRDREFLDMLAVTNLLPGPNSTEMAIHLGQRRAGWAGWLAAGTMFILPAAVLSALLAWLYDQGRDLTALPAVFRGLQPVMLGVIVEAVRRLGKTAIGGTHAALVALAAGAAGLWGVPELAVLPVAGLWGWAWHVSRRHRRGGGGPPAAGVGAAVGAGIGMALQQPAVAGASASVAQPAGPAIGAAGAAAGTGGAGWAWPAGVMAWLPWEPATLGGMTLSMLKTGAVLFGSGYLLINFLRSDFVATGLLTEAELLDAVAVGQFTPGPLLSTATFIGWRLHGPAGAVLATAAIFLPAFLAVAAVAGRVERLRESPAWTAVLDAINPAVVGLMAATAWALAGATLTVATGAAGLPAGAASASGAVSPVAGGGATPWAVMTVAGTGLDVVAVAAFLGSWAFAAWGRYNAAWLLLPAAVIGLMRG